MTRTLWMILTEPPGQLAEWMEAEEVGRVRVVTEAPRRARARR